jgi:predicted amidophosphoribosyltransferase
LAAQSLPAYRNVDVLIPVPLHWKRKIQRGYNQSEWICLGIASVWHTPIELSVLKRKT